MDFYCSFPRLQRSANGKSFINEKTITPRCKRGAEQINKNLFKSVKIRVIRVPIEFCGNLCYLRNLRSKNRKK